MSSNFTYTAATGTSQSTCPDRPIKDGASAVPQNNEKVQDVTKKISAITGEAALNGGEMFLLGSLSMLPLGGLLGGLVGTIVGGINKGTEGVRMQYEVRDYDEEKDRMTRGPKERMSIKPMKKIPPINRFYGSGDGFKDRSGNLPSGPAPRFAQGNSTRKPRRKRTSGDSGRGGSGHRGRVRVGVGQQHNNNQSGATEKTTP